MNIVLLGPPGSGKGTQSRLISMNYDLMHISTGDLLREALDKKIDVGIDLEDYLKNGKLVPDEVITNLLQNKLIKSKNGYILDGYPRTIPQAKFLESIMEPSVVILLDTDFKFILNRILTRSTCSECKATLIDMDLVEGKCPHCSGDTYKRADDNEETLAKRFTAYENLTLPLIEYYTSKNLLVRVDGNGDIEEIFGKIKNVLGESK